MAQRIVGRQQWIDYEADVRCPVVLGRGRRGLAQAKRDLNGEWNALLPARRQTVIDRLQEALRVEDIVAARTDTALMSLTRADNIRAQANADEATEHYFRACDDALRRHAELRDECMDAATAWASLRNYYRLMFAVNRTGDQQRSIDGASLRFTTAFDARNAAQVQYIVIRNRIRIDPVYAAPIPNGPIALEGHVPWQRFENAPRTALAADGFPGIWTASPLVLEGGNNSPTVWYRMDAQGNVINRLVKKVQEVNLYDFLKMNGDFPRELESHQRATAGEAGEEFPAFVELLSTNEVRLKSWVNRHRKEYAVYTAWCGHGSLDQLIRDYIARGLRIPEPMIWNVFRCLVRAGQRMSNFHPPNAGNEIVHRDLKPANIFLDAPHTAVGGNVFYPNYPKARVGDFGQAFITNANDPFNPDWWTGFCATRGWTPPDLERYVDPNTLQPAAANTLNERTNVWQAGAILRAMILLEPDPVQSLFLNQANDNTYLVVGHPAAAGYTPNLLTCIDIMMRYDIGQRPTWYALNGLIQNPIPGIITPDDVAMRNGTAVGAQLAANTLHFPGDQFTIGFPPT